MDQLRLLTCGSVDDGKSTLIGRLLHDANLLHDDRLAAVYKESALSGHAGDHVDLALVADGLRAEREQGITIDVAYLYFSTPQRSFILADTPGHEQYTRNMVIGASTADLAIILVDATRGITTQTRRHSLIVSLMRIPSIVVAVNKMDLVDYDAQRFTSIEAEAQELAHSIGLTEPECIPVSALCGDAVVRRGSNLDWYKGPTLLAHLESVEPLRQAPASTSPLRMPVQYVIRPDHTFRGFAGTVVSGTLRVGDRIRVEPSQRHTNVERIVTFDGEPQRCRAGPGRRHHHY